MVMSIPYFLSGEQKEAVYATAAETLKEQEASLGVREAIVRKREELVGSVEGFYKAKEAELRAREESLQQGGGADSSAAKLAELKDREKWVERLEVAHKKREGKLKAMAEVAEKRAIQLDEREKAIKAREEKIGKREESLLFLTGDDGCTGDVVLPALTGDGGKRKKGKKRAPSSPNCLEVVAALEGGAVKKRKAGRPPKDSNWVKKVKREPSIANRAFALWYGENKVRLREEAKANDEHPLMRGNKEYAQLGDKSKWVEVAKGERLKTGDDTPTGAVAEVGVDEKEVKADEGG